MRRTTPPAIILWVGMALMCASAYPALAQSPSPAAGSSPFDGLSLVVVGDSIPFNSPDDCPGCTGFVDQYAAALGSSTGRSVAVHNLSEHTGLQTAGLLSELRDDPVRRDALAGADVIIVSIGHNDTPWNRADDPCDGNSEIKVATDFAGYPPGCATASADMLAADWASVFTEIAGLREGRPTVAIALNVYNDWLGWPVDPSWASPVVVDATSSVIDVWDAGICGAATASGFVCADIYRAFNGPDGTTPAGPLLAGDYTHPSQAGNDLITKVLVDAGQAPVRLGAAPSHS